MENKVSDEKLQLFAGMETIDAVDKTVKSMASELLALRADAETSQNHNAAVIDPLVTQLRDAGYTGTLSEMVGQACALQEATRWIPIGERLPETRKPVLSLAVKDKKFYIEKACYIPPRTVLSEDFLSDEFDCESVQEYDEENDSYWVVEGWWESSWESDANWKLSGDVTHWMPLPVPPEGGTK